MGKYTIELSKRAAKELKSHYQSGQKATIGRIERIFKELADDPYSGIGDIKSLKGSLSGYFSRKINKKDRIVYRVNDDTVTAFVVSAIGHYEDK